MIVYSSEVEGREPTKLMVLPLLLVEGLEALRAYSTQDA